MKLLLELQEKEEMRLLKKETVKESKPKKIKSVIETDHWYCAHCTFANDKSSKKCDMCNNTKKILKNPTF